MSKFRTSILALLLCIFFIGLTDCSTDPLKTIADVCFEQSIKLCEDQIVGTGTTRDVFILIVKLIKKYEKVMSLYESRFGLNETKRLNKSFNFKRVLPEVSDYEIKEINKNERLYIGKNGDQITLSKIDGKWKFDVNKSHFKAFPSADKIKKLRLFLGFYHDLEERLEHEQSLGVIEKSIALGLAGMLYHEIPPDRPEKEGFRKFLRENATTPEEIQRKYLDIADKL